MVRRATLQVEDYLFLLPEYVDGVVEYPCYAKVTAISTDMATVRKIDLDDPATCNVGIATARMLTVTKAEATRRRQRRLLCQPAWTESAAQFWHDQVVGVEGRLGRLQLEDRVVRVEPSLLTPVAPVVALLLLPVQLHASMTQDSLLDMQMTILARILNGSVDAPEINAIPAILNGLVEGGRHAGRQHYSPLDRPPIRGNVHRSTTTRSQLRLRGRWKLTTTYRVTTGRRSIVLSRTVHPPQYRQQHFSATVPRTANPLQQHFH